MFPRIREITDAFGARLRVSVEQHPAGALVMLELADQHRPLRISLDRYGAEVLWGYIMAVRLAVPGSLPEERIGGQFPSRLCLRRHPRAALVVVQAEAERPFEIAATFWDRLYAELSVVIAHAREFERLCDRPTPTAGWRN